MGKGRRPCCDKAGVKKGPWSQAEDFKLISFIQKHGHNNWRALPKLAGLARCGKSCRLRWVNYLRPDLKRGGFTPQEEETIIKLHEALGNKWSKIASHFPGRTDNEIKNVWNTHLKKRLKVKGCHDKVEETLSSNNKSLTNASDYPNDNLDESDDNLNCCHDQQVLTNQAITTNINDTTLESSSSSSSSFNSSQASLSSYPKKNELNHPNMLLENVGDHKEETSGCMDYYKSIEDPLKELIEIPFEPNLDLWDLLQGDDNNEVQFNDVDTLISENDKKNDNNNNNNSLMQDGGSWWWLVYLENELGLDHQSKSTLLQSTNNSTTSPCDLFSDISI